ncbi:histidinol dehydrogenase [Streptomyces sp. 35G-GA-8]|uniref:histidinol dehydrogenase n=1 Tax=Streptomyces sp. 35G-GA-8 TaxID=2939434 RepID=UPI00201EB7CD|nr:histidinol dehydrogenase [Streptomyces sp. 35G-GA-8]MCL7377228.1 histidinol dehydrogenase [Streptomyces sp. 35G-GA-8]
MATDGGPGELMAVADTFADPALLAADLVAHLECGPTASAVVVTAHEFVADAVEAEIESLPTSGGTGAGLIGARAAVVLVDDLEQAVDVVEEYGPQTLAIHSVYAVSPANRVRNVGEVYAASFSPAGLGRYGFGATSVLAAGEARLLYA